MRVGRIEQLLFQLVELRRDAQDVGLDLLDLLVQAFHLRAGVLVCRTRACAEAQQNADYDQEMLTHRLLPCGYRVASHLRKLRWHQVEGGTRSAQQARGARASPVSQMPLRGAPQACGLTAFESYASMTCSPPNRCRDTRTTRADAVRWKDWITAVPLS